MLQFDQNWLRWCKISYAKHVDVLRGDVPLYIEGFAPNPDNLLESQSYFELRVDGPYSKEKAKGQWELYFEINVLIVHHQSDMDAYGLERMIGQVNLFFEPLTVAVRKYGTGPNDDQELLGWLHLDRSQVKSSNFGRIRPDTRIYQASVEGHYTLNMD